MNTIAIVVGCMELKDRASALITSQTIMAQQLIPSHAPIRNCLPIIRNKVCVVYRWCDTKRTSMSEDSSSIATLVL